MIKPEKLNIGDKIATISLSWGGAGEIPNRYQAGKRQIQEELGLEVVETKNALRSADWLYRNPQARAEDLMEAFSDKSIKAIFSNIGGDESVRILPYTDLNIIKANPKIFMGYSDTNVTHFSCYQAGLVSFYGTSVMTGFAENGGMHSYTLDSIKKTLFSNEIIGEIKPSEFWTSEMLGWENPDNQNIKRKLNNSEGWKFLQGNGKVQGRLIGGCFDVLEFLKGTKYWVDNSFWKDSIIFFETSEVLINPGSFIDSFRNYATQNILQNAKGILFARPYRNQFSEEYEKAILKIIQQELEMIDFPIITNMDFGHNDPVFTIPYGIMAEIDCENKTFSIIENAVI